MAKDPAFLFYTGDFSTGTQFFTDEQVGKYIRLLLAQHQIGHLHEKHMLQICKTHDKDVFAKFIKDEDGLYFNQRLDNEIFKRKKYSESRSNNRKKTDKNANMSSSYDFHMENRNKDSINHTKKPLENSIVKEEENNISKGEQKLKFEEDMVVLEMMKIWMKQNPSYPKDTDSDYPALLQMAYKIARVKGWKESEVVNFKELDVLVSWGKIVAFIASDNFLKNLAIKNLTNQFQMIYQKMANSTKDNQDEKPKAKSEPQQAVQKEYWEIKYGHLAKTKKEFMKLVAEGKIDD